MNFAATAFQLFGSVQVVDLARFDSLRPIQKRKNKKNKERLAFRKEKEKEYEND